MKTFTSICLIDSINIMSVFCKSETQSNNIKWILRNYCLKDVLTSKLFGPCMNNLHVYFEKSNIIQNISIFTFLASLVFTTLCKFDNKISKWTKYPRYIEKQN